MGGSREDVWVTESAGHDGRKRWDEEEGRKKRMGWQIRHRGCRTGLLQTWHVVSRYARFVCLVVESADIFPDSHQQGDAPDALRAHHPAEQLAHGSAPSVSTI